MKIVSFIFIYYLLNFSLIRSNDDDDENISKYDGKWAFEISESSIYKDNYGLILKVKKYSQLISFSNHQFFSQEEDIMLSLFIEINHLTFQQVHSSCNTDYNRF